MVKMSRWKTVAVALVATTALMTGGAVAATAGGDNASAPTPQPRAGVNSPSESVFVPITPCRIVNTATSGAGRFVPGETRAYESQGNTSSQGGAAACNIPATASALEVNITAPSALGEGYVRVAPAGVAIPNATFMNFTDTFNASNAGTVAITPGSGNNLQVRVFNAQTHIVVDVLGYYVKELFAVIGSDGTLIRGNGVVSATRVSLGDWTVGFDRNLTGCSFVATPGTTGFAGTVPPAFIEVAGEGGNSNGVFVSAENQAGNEVDTSFHLQVDC